MTMRQRFEFFAPIWRVMVRRRASFDPRFFWQSGACARASLATPPLPLLCHAPQRDSAMTVEEVVEQVRHVALVTKQASSVSDLRHHTFAAPGVKVGCAVCGWWLGQRHRVSPGAQLLGFHCEFFWLYCRRRWCTSGPRPRAPARTWRTRAQLVRRRLAPRAELLHCQRAVAARVPTGGGMRLLPLAAAVPHGACWYDLCDDLEVIDVPGDHFSLLRQAGASAALCGPHEGASRPACPAKLHLTCCPLSRRTPAT